MIAFLAGFLRGSCRLHQAAASVGQLVAAHRPALKPRQLECVELPALNLRGGGEQAIEIIVPPREAAEEVPEFEAES